jgi:hypothetical protein
MIFQIKQKKNKFLEEVYNKSMQELNDFYGINWIENRPKIVIVNDRKTIDSLHSRKTEDWLVGWADFGSTIYLLNSLNYKTESNHTFKKESYSMLIKHELSHLFFGILIKQNYAPVWLNEGVAIYLSGQNKFKKEIQEFKTFLNYYDKGSCEVYNESGFFVQMLVEKYGKEKFLKFLISLQKIKNRKEFDSLFFKTYKFSLNYKEINKIIEVRT